MEKCGHVSNAFEFLCYRNMYIITELSASCNEADLPLKLIFFHLCKRVGFIVSYIEPAN